MMDARSTRTMPVRTRADAGFSLIELVIVVTIISIIAAIAQPQMHGVLLKARAAEIVGDLEVIKVAALSYQSESNAWPPDASSGTIPPELVDFLPDGFVFTNERYTLDFENWGGVPFNIGVAVIPTEPELGLAVLDLLGKPVFQSGPKYNWVID